MDAKILIYFKITELSGKRLQLKLEKEFSPEVMETCHDFQTLSKRLHQSGSDMTLLVLIISDSQELARMITVEQYLHEFRIILILPDCLEETHAMAHKLFPKFISYMDSDFQDVLLVMQNLMKKIEQLNAPGERIHHIL